MEIYDKLISNNFKIVNLVKTISRNFMVMSSMIFVKNIQIFFFKCRSKCKQNMNDENVFIN